MARHLWCKYTATNWNKQSNTAGKILHLQHITRAASPLPGIQQRARYPPAEAGNWLTQIVQNLFALSGEKSHWFERQQIQQQCSRGRNVQPDDAKCRWQSPLSVQEYFQPVGQQPLHFAWGCKCPVEQRAQRRVLLSQPLHLYRAIHRKTHFWARQPWLERRLDLLRPSKREVLIGIDFSLFIF